MQRRRRGRCHSTESSEIVAAEFAIPPILATEEVCASRALEGDAVGPRVRGRRCNAEEGGIGAPPRYRLRVGVVGGV